MSCSKNIKLNPTDVFRTYKSSYKNKIPWCDILHPQLSRWLNIFQNARNCSVNLTMGCLLSLVPALCGPNTKVQTNDGSFQSPINTYLIAVCDPGGGKTNTFNHVLEPVFEDFLEKKKVPLNIETYTLPGVQKHQLESDGRGLICSDEGNIVLTHVKTKQTQGNNEVPFLCKLWSGKGDVSTLATGTRGFEKTSMSIFLAIQPEPMIQHVSHFSGNDGFLERFLMISAKPFMTTSAVTRQFHKLFMKEKMQDFKPCGATILAEHDRDNKTYTLSSEAQIEYDHIVDSFAISLKQKYCSDSG